MKKVLSVVLTIALLISFIPLGVFDLTASAETPQYTEGYYTYTVENGEAVIIDVDTTISGDIIIPSTLGGYPVIGIGLFAFEFCKNITEIEIQHTVTSVANAAFSACSNLQTIHIGSSVKESLVYSC